MCNFAHVEGLSDVIWSFLRGIGECVSKGKVKIQWGRLAKPA